MDSLRVSTGRSGRSGAGLAGLYDYGAGASVQALHCFRGARRVRLAGEGRGDAKGGAILLTPELEGSKKSLSAAAVSL